MRNLLVLVVLGLSLSFGVKSYGQSACDDLGPPAEALCRSYCERMECESDEPNGSEQACARVLSNYERLTNEPMPCVDPCAELGPCPCVFDLIPKDETCWPGDPNGSWFTLPAPGLLCQLDDPTTQFTALSIFGIANLYTTCNVIFDGTANPDCPPLNIALALTRDEIPACICRLEHYAEELVQAGLVVDGGAFICPPETE